MAKEIGSCAGACPPAIFFAHFPQQPVSQDLGERRQGLLFLQIGDAAEQVKGDPLSQDGTAPGQGASCRRELLQLGQDEPPIIQPNCLANDADTQVLVAGLKLARRLGEAEALAPFRDTEILPGPQVQSDEEWKAFIRANAATFFHTVGTCKMGSDPMAVVDAELRVHGVEGLRVVDASIMPTVVGGNTNAATIMIAEKAADLIQGRTPASTAEVSA
jgi:choline dehydrogenase-like flavoprotein